MSRYISSTLILITLIGCSSLVPDSLRIDQISYQDEISENAQRSESFGPPARFSVAMVKDRRAQSEIGRVDLTQPIEAIGNIEREVRTAVERSLRAHGFMRSSFEGPYINVDIQDWFVDLKMAIPSSFASARAKIGIEVMGEAGKRLFSGVYEGKSEVEHPLIKTQAEQALGRAMGLAIEEVAADAGLRSALEAATLEMTRNNEQVNNNRRYN